MPHFFSSARPIADALALMVCCALGARADDGLAEISRDAYIYTFPLHELYRLRYLALYNPINPQRVRVNQFVHRRELSDHTSRRVTTSNNDTIYSSSFLDLSRRPLILDVPDIADRYYSLAFMDFYTNNFACIGTRMAGAQAGKYVIAGPGWRAGAVPQR